MPTPLTSISGIGPAMAEMLARAGIPDAETLREIGADAAYLAKLRVGVRPHFIAYYALVMALQGRPWNDCKGAEKDALRLRFDALKDEAFGKTGAADTKKGHPRMEAALDALGLGLRR